MGQLVYKLVQDMTKFLTQYYYRNLSESRFSADKRRFGGLIRQKRVDRQKTVLLTNTLLHNIFTIRINPK